MNPMKPCRTCQHWFHDSHSLTWPQPARQRCLQNRHPNLSSYGGLWMALGRWESINRSWLRPFILFAQIHRTLQPRQIHYIEDLFMRLCFCVATSYHKRLWHTIPSGNFYGHVQQQTVSLAEGRWMYLKNKVPSGKHTKSYRKWP